MRVLRVYHAGRDAAHRNRERALLRAGVDVVLVAPSDWPGEGSGHRERLADEFEIVELPVRRAGDINRHTYASKTDLTRVIQEVVPDVLDVHEEPFSLAARQCLACAPQRLPIVMYTAQNLDKRFPPPFAQYEQAALRRVAALYPCTAQAASVARGKGFTGLIDVLPLGFDPAIMHPGIQAPSADEIVLGFFGRLVPEKGGSEAVRVLASLTATRPTRLVVVGDGPDLRPMLRLAETLGVREFVEVHAWQRAEQLAVTYRRCHFVLIPSRPTTTWVEQFGRVIVEAQASGAIVAGFASGAIPEVSGKSAVLVGTGDVDGLSMRMIGLLNDPVEYDRRRDAGVRLARDRTWQRIAEHQAHLYGVAAGGVAHLNLPTSPADRRSRARLEFGSPAATLGGERPFALPMLRAGGSVPHILGRVLDVGAELGARARARRH